MPHYVRSAAAALLPFHEILEVQIVKASGRPMGYHTRRAAAERIQLRNRNVLEHDAIVDLDRRIGSPSGQLHIELDIAAQTSICARLFAITGAPRSTTLSRSSMTSRDVMVLPPRQCHSGSTSARNIRHASVEFFPRPMRRSTRRGLRQRSPRPTVHSPCHVEAGKQLDSPSIVLGARARQRIRSKTPTTTRMPISRRIPTTQASTFNMRILAHERCPMTLGIEPGFRPGTIALPGAPSQGT